MDTRTLAHGGPAVSALGLSCMGMSGGAAEGAESQRTLERALELGISLFDTAELYGNGHNETLLGPFVRRHRNRVVLATKVGTMQSLADIAPGDTRASAPRWQPDTFDRNKALAAEVVAIASTLGVTAAQLSLAWPLARSNDIIPIPGTRTIRHLQENAGALEIRLRPQQQTQLEATASKAAVAGVRGMGGARRA